MFAVMLLKGALVKSLQQMILCSTQQSTERGQMSPLGNKYHSLESKEFQNLPQSTHKTFSTTSQADQYLFIVAEISRSAVIDELEACVLLLLHEAE